MGTRCADHVTPLYPQKLALTSPTGGGRSVGIVRVRIKATEFNPGVHYETPCTITNTESVYNFVILETSSVKCIFNNYFLAK